MGRAVPTTWKSASPHPDPQRELLCQHLARGAVSASRAYALVWSVSNPATAKTNAHRVQQEPAVAQRIVAIREALAQPLEAEPVDITEGRIRTLMAEVTGAFEAALAEGERVRASPALLSALRRAATVHLGRVQRLQTRAAPEVIIDDTEDPVRAALERMRLCACQSAPCDPGENP